MILLFAPPFDRGSLEPGYIKGYVPGIRENGGQYTHAATWVVLATALLGRGKRALELFALLNPVRHGATPEDVARYMVEPYVVAADVYGAPPHTGTGRLDLVHRLGQLAVPRRPRGDSRFPQARGLSEDRAVRRAGLAALRAYLPPPLGDLPYRRRERSRHGPRRACSYCRRAGRARWRDPAHGRRKNP